MKITKDFLKQIIIEEVTKEAAGLNTSTIVSDKAQLANILKSNMGQKIKWTISPELQKELNMKVNESGAITFQTN